MSKNKDENEQATGTAPEKVPEPAKKEKIDFVKKYAGKEVILSGKTNVWGFGSLFSLSIIPDDEGNLTNIKGVIPESAVPTLYESVHKAVESGVMFLTSDLSKEQIASISKVTVVETNTPSMVEELVVYDELLSKEIPSLQRELENVKKEGKKGVEFFKSLLAEEKYSQNRESYIELIEKYIG
jgi:ribosomal protein L30E